MSFTLKPIIDKTTSARLQKLINDAEHIVITCHVSPDGDALGSSLGLCQVLQDLGKSAVVVTPDMVPRQLLFIPNVKSIVVASCQPHVARQCISRADLIFFLDFNELKRIDKLAEIVETSNAERVMIDHHLDPAPIASITISHPEVSSTSALVYRVLNDLGYIDKLNIAGATCICTGMMTDTGNFSYNSLDPQLYLIMADLVARGVDKDEVYRSVFNTSSESKLRLQGYAISRNLRLFHEYGTALITLSGEELNQYHYERGDTEGLVNVPLSIPGIRCSVFMRQDSENYVKISARSIGDFPVNLVCERYFGGGGHLNAAGGDWNGSLDEAVSTFIRIMESDSDLWNKKETIH